MLTTYLNWLRKAPPWLRAGYRTGYQTFVGVFGLTLVGWLNDVQGWAGGSAVDFPSVSPLGKAAVGALTAALAGSFAALQNAVGSKGAVYPRDGS